MTEEINFDSGKILGSSSQKNWSAIQFSHGQYSIQATTYYHFT